MRWLWLYKYLTCIDVGLDGVHAPDGFNGSRLMQLHDLFAWADGVSGSIRCIGTLSGWSVQTIQG
jgi:hypothetical protein